MKKIVLIAWASLALSGCAALPAISAASSIASGFGSTGDKVVLEGTRAFVVGEHAYNGAATLANEVGKACLEAPSVPCPISASDAGRIRTLNATATELLVRGKATRDETARAVAGRDLLAIAATLDELRR
jgi:hypothetical protein